MPCGEVRSPGGIQRLVEAALHAGCKHFNHGSKVLL